MIEILTFVFGLIAGIATAWLFGRDPIEQDAKRGFANEMDDDF